MTDGTMQPYALTLDKFLAHAAKWHPRTEVVTARNHGGLGRSDYAGVYDRARRASTVLAKRGVALGDRVATLAWNSCEHLEAWYAIMAIGAVCHTLNPRLTSQQVGAMVAQSGAAVIIVSADLLPMAHEIAALAPGVRELLVIDVPEVWQDAAHAALPVVSLAEQIDDELEPSEWGVVDENLPSGLCFTSGTTGDPKGVTYTHRSSYLHTLRLLQADVLAITAHDVVLPVVPMFHANAWGLPFAVPAAGAKLVLPGRNADGASLARLIADEGVTIAVGVPTLWLGLLDHVEATGTELPTLQRIAVGGAPMAPALMARLEERLGVMVQTSWGMTELSPSGTFAPLRDAERDPQSAGRPAIGIDLRLVDADDCPLPDQRGGEGRLMVRGPSVVERYFGAADPAKAVDGWFDTGDLARIDATGNLFITGRSKDLIKSGGEWINPAEIEAIVATLPQVALAAVIGREDQKWGERPILLVEMRDGLELSDETLLDTLRGKVASWWLPDAVVRVPAMPLASTGKIDKLRLRATFGGA